MSTLEEITGVSKGSLLVISALFLALLFLASFVIRIVEAAPPGCFDLILNGDFEGIGGWQINVSPATPAYVPAPNRSGLAMRLGITEVPNRLAYSSITQTITIPANAVSAELHWDFFAIAEGPMDNDRQELVILDPTTRQTREIIWRVRRDDRTWLTAVADMLSYRGQTITLYFNVFNDGVGAVDQTAAMYLDNVRLDVCTGVTATPTSTPGITATPTATPTAPTPTATLTPSPTPTPDVRIIYIEYNPPGSDVEGEYVLIQNFTSSPVNMTGWTLRDQAGNTFTFPPFSLNPSASVRLWTKSGTNTLYDLYWGRGSAVWNNEGDTAYLRDTSGVLIHTYSYLVTPVPTFTPSPTFTVLPATLTPTFTPFPPITLTPTPTLTSIPGDCYELLDNGGFETDATWQFLPTRLWPTYVGPPYPVHSGLRSVMLGNRPLPDAVSYSSVRQEISIPFDAQTAFIRFWYWAQSDDTDGGDRQQLSLLDPDTYARIQDLWRPSPPRNEQSWRWEEFDLTPYRGYSILVYFNVYNDGDGKRTVMFLDDVTLQACYTLPTATPVPTAAGSGLSFALPSDTPTPPLHYSTASTFAEEANMASLEAALPAASPAIALPTAADHPTNRRYLLVGTGVLLAFGIVTLGALIAWWVRARGAVRP
jgi:hypothetical protein